MNRTVFRQIPNGSRLLAVGNFFRAPTSAAEWRLAALFERNGQLQLQRFAPEMSCVLAVGREFLGEEGAPYRPSGFKKTVVLPAIDTWRERQLGECPRLARRLAANPEISGQRCFVFEVDGLTVWLPKFELARKLFFHAAFIVRAAFAPNGLDMVFTLYREGDVVHIHTPPKTGAPSQLLKIKGYRDHFSWLLLNQDVKRSFESIWQSLNQRQARDRKLVRLLIRIGRDSEEDRSLPRRSRNWFLQQLPHRASVEHHLAQLPLCRTFLDRYAESVGEYQIRRLTAAMLEDVQTGITSRRWELEKRCGLEKSKMAPLTTEFIRLVGSWIE